MIYFIISSFWSSVLFGEIAVIDKSYLRETHEVCVESEFEEILKKVDKGNVDGFFQYGDYLFRGKCVKKNLEQAFLFFYKAAKQGHIKAYFNVAVMLHVGLGVKVDDDKATRMFESMLKANYPPAIQYVCNLSNKYKLDITYWNKKYNLECNR